MSTTACKGTQRRLQRLADVSPVWSKWGEPALVVAVVALLAAVQPGAAQSSGGGGGGAILGLVLWVAIGAAVAWFMIRNRSAFQMQTSTSLAPEDALESLERSFTVAGWQIASKRRDGITFRTETKGSCLIALLLLLIGIIPGLLYLAFRGRMMTVDVDATAGPAGSTVRLNGSTRGFGGYQAAESAIRALPGGPAPALTA